MLNAIFKVTTAVGTIALDHGAGASAHSLDAMLKDLDPATLGEVDLPRPATPKHSRISTSGCCSCIT